MKKWIIAALAFMLGANLAVAQVTVCDKSVLQDRRLAVESRKNLEKSCKHIGLVTHCQALADDRKLLGDAKLAFMQKCASLPPTRGK